MSTETHYSRLWEQRTLFPTAVVEITLKIGVVIESDHCQLELEAKDPSTDKVLALSSRPHVPLDDVARVLPEWLELTSRMVQRFTEPFPDL